MNTNKAECERLFVLFSKSKVYGPKSGITEARRLSRYLTLNGEDEEHYKRGPLTRDQLICLGEHLCKDENAHVVHVDVKVPALVTADRLPVYVSVPARTTRKRTRSMSLYNTPLKQPLINGLVGDYVDPNKCLQQSGIDWVVPDSIM